MPRLYHSKSKTGCARCRARRVKCDEALPKCGHCTRHQVSCVYDRSHDTLSPNAGNVAQAASPRNHASVLESRSLPDGEMSSPESRARRYLELRLLHIWTVDVATTLPGCYEPENLRTWTAEVPRLALEYEPLLNAVFSISLLYMALGGSQSTLSHDELLAAKAKYFEATLQDHRKALSSMSRHNADAIGFTTIILVFDAFASLRERRQETTEPYRPPTEWLHMCRGVRHIVMLGLDVVGEDPSSALKNMAKGTSEFIDTRLIFCEANWSRFPYLLAPHDGEVEDNDDNEACVAAVAYIGSIVAGMEAGEIALKTARRLTIFPILLQGRFLTLLELQRPRAMVILAHYFAVACSLKDLWWIGDSPAREIAAIKANLRPGWDDLMSWPLKALDEHG